MVAFTVLLGGDLTATQRLRRQVAKTRVIAADSGIMHASILRLAPELWVGDFDSAGSELALEYRDVPREIHPHEKDETDGAIAVAAALTRGATSIVLAGGLGGQTDHAAGLLGQSLRLATDGISCFITSGAEEAWPLIPGGLKLDLPDDTRLSIVPFADIAGLDIAGVKWPLSGHSVPVGSTLTISNFSRGPVAIELRSGYGMVFAYPRAAGD